MFVGGLNVTQKDVDVIFSLAKLRGSVDTMRDKNITLGNYLTPLREDRIELQRLY